MLSLHSTPFNFFSNRTGRFAPRDFAFWTRGSQSPVSAWQSLFCSVAIMIPARRAPKTLSRLSASNPSRQFSYTPAAAAISPYRNPNQASASKTASETARREQSTTAAQTKTTERPVPAPAFNRDDTRWNDVQQPLRPYRPQGMDHSFVGMTGGEIFHEMMLRQGVKHVCESCPWLLDSSSFEVS